MLKIFNKALIGIKRLWLAAKNIKINGLLKNPLFYFGLTAVFLFGAMYSACDSSNGINRLGNSRVVFFNSFFDRAGNLDSNSLFSSTTNAIPLETPDLEIIQDNTVYGISTPQIVSGKVLGDVFGGSNQNQKDVVDYSVQPGDTLQSIADSYNISANTLLWANDLTSSSTIKVGQSLTILPVDGVLHVVKSGDTVFAIAQKYKAQVDDIISYNSLANQDDIYIGDVLIIPGGVMPKTASPIEENQSSLSGSFIFPTEGVITQGLHYYNAIDVANKCGTPIHAVANGVVERSVFNNAWNMGMGNYVTILHANGVVTYYGHFEYIYPSIYPGASVSVGDIIGLMGRTGDATGCHVHFEVIGAVNPLAKYPVGTNISYSSK